ncbi:G5 domain-containing protein [Naasia lichenicola]|uniref:DUF2510 domain-containing protein n=1 Tax=Naasia lichenicola TaxID=2565933 RepID=A0A4S4FSG3_9MICO|nr:G5 domain-containing protein [Naasia lichenicola]THG33238.1 DUF2510 domain-containing protein [Naasia lichenicola]
MTVPAGWYTDPKNPAHLRWWSGAHWTAHIAVPESPQIPEASRPVAPARAEPVLPIEPESARSPNAHRAQAASLAGSRSVASIAPVTASATTPEQRSEHRRDPTRRPSKRFILSVVGGAAAILVISAVANAAVNSGNGLASVAGDDEPIGFAASAPTPRSTSTPVASVEMVDVTEGIPFSSSEVDDPNLAVGATTVLMTGVNGVRTQRFRVMYLDGKETSRELVSDTITTSPIDQVTAIGSYVAPAPVVAAPVVQPPVAEAPASPPTANDGCDPNYEGACVPIDTDVDCAGGSGNGPSYAQGPFQVVGSDIYGLDSDDGGVGCEN